MTGAHSQQSAVGKAMVGGGSPVPGLYFIAFCPAHESVLEREQVGVFCVFSNVQETSFANLY